MFVNLWSYTNLIKNCRCRYDFEMNHFATGMQYLIGLKFCIRENYFQFSLFSESGKIFSIFPAISNSIGWGGSDGLSLVEHFPEIIDAWERAFDECLRGRRELHPEPLKQPQLKWGFCLEFSSCNANRFYCYSDEQNASLPGMLLVHNNVHKISSQQAIDSCLPAWWLFPCMEHNFIWISKMFLPLSGEVIKVLIVGHE